MGPLIFQSKNVLKSAGVKLDEQKSELLACQKNILQSQNEVISLQKMKLDSVQQTVQKEIKTFSDVVKENCSGKSSTVTPGNLKQAMRTAIVDEERPRNFLIFRS